MIPDFEDVVALCRQAREAFNLDRDVDADALRAVLDEARALCLSDAEAPAVIFFVLARHPSELREWCIILARLLPTYVAARRNLRVNATDIDLLALMKQVQHHGHDLTAVRAWFAPRLSQLRPS